MRWFGALLLLVAACSKSQADTLHETRRTGPHVIRLDAAALERGGVKIEPAGVGGDSRVLRVPGTLDYNYDRYAEVGVPLEGRATRVDVKVSDVVKKGQVLAQILVPSVAAAQADYLSAKAVAAAAKKNREREDDLFAQKLTTAREAEVAKSDAVKADAELAAAEARLHALRVALPTSDSAVASAGALTLTSPIDGIVISRKVHLGVYLTPEESAFVIADLSELWANLDIPESDLPYLALGADVGLAFDALPNKKFVGKLSALDPQLGKATRTAKGRLIVPNPDGALRVGLFVRAEVQLPSDHPALLIAARAVQPLGEDDVVFVDKGNGSFEVRTVKVARRTVDVVEIGDGLKSGERIAVDGAFVLRGEASKQ